MKGQSGEIKGYRRNRFLDPLLEGEIDSGSGKTERIVDLILRPGGIISGNLGFFNGLKGPVIFPFCTLFNPFLIMIFPAWLGGEREGHDFVFLFRFDPPEDFTFQISGVTISTEVGKSTSSVSNSDRRPGLLDLVRGRYNIIRQIGLMIIEADRKGSDSLPVALRTGSPPRRVPAKHIMRSVFDGVVLFYSCKSKIKP